MNYRDLILESYLEDEYDDTDMLDSYDEDYEEYEYEDDDDDSDYDDAYLEGYFYALMENREVKEAAKKLGLNPNAKPGTPEHAAYSAWAKGRHIETNINVAQAEEASKNRLQKAKDRGSVTKGTPDATGKVGKVHRTKFNDSELNADLKKARDANAARGAKQGAAAAAAGKAPKVTGKQAAAAAGIVAGAGAIATGATIAVKTKKEYNAYKAAGGKLSLKEWIKAGKPAPKAPEKAIAAVKRVMKEAYDQAYLEAYYGTLDELGMLD